MDKFNANESVDTTRLEKLFLESGTLKVFRKNEGNYIPVYTSLSIIITNSHKLIGIEFVRNKERR